MVADQKILEVNNLNVHYFTANGTVIAANAVNLYVKQGEILGLVGESGCGKTTVAMSILQMVSSPGRIVSGEVKIQGQNIVDMPERELRNIRWRKLALIPQGAMNSLNPVTRISEQVGDVIMAHEKISRVALMEKVLKLLNDVGLPERIYNMYPHELSGGMKQRVCIAMAVALTPAIIVADEPTSALDVVVQRLVAQTILDAKNRLGVSMILIGHDMGFIAQMVDRVAVMYAGNLVEVGTVESIFGYPYHPYTQLLIDSIPSTKQKKALKVTEGLTHDLRNPPVGCCFQFRCPFVRDACKERPPAFKEMAPDHFVACIQH